MGLDPIGNGIRDKENGMVKTGFYGNQIRR